LRLSHFRTPTSPYTFSLIETLGVVCCELSNPFISQYVERTRGSKEQFLKGQARIPGGHTRAALFFEPYPVYLRYGKGSRIWDIDGNEMVDFHNNYTALILGHANPRVVEAVTRRLKDGVSFGAPTQDEFELADIINRRMPSVERVKFCNSGTEATMYALLIAKTFTGRKKILKFEGAHHGIHEFALVSENPPLDWDKYPRGSPDVEGVSLGILEDVMVARFNDQESVERVVKQTRNELAAIIVEPIMGSAGSVPAQRDFLRFLRETADRIGCVLILDEVITGFRVGPGGGQQYYGLKPDLTTLGKIIGGGFPVGGYGGREDIMKICDMTKGAKISLSGTFSANPIVMTAGATTLKQLTPDAYEKLHRNGEVIWKGLKEIGQSSGVPTQVTGVDSLFSIHFTDQEVVDYRSAKSDRTDLKQVFFMGMLVKGIFVTPRGMCTLSVPMGSQEIQAFLDSARDTFSVLRSIRPDSSTDNKR